ncbi:hypothetical protein D9613_011768 [Agrocybe pediades]|uniref:Uncharacterized protein n=1 Tax=Agrocybe pediades TaxID=84607 RepID=A0A8H4VM10_9AGAR|nr:hypothetical protein D9613_011768 [Agrocybe pediades]
MPVGEYSLRLQKGITGGFAPPTPDFIYTLTRPLTQEPPTQDSLLITSAVRPAGTPSLQDAVPKRLSLTDETTSLVDELHSILKSLPTEQPPGSEDIYGLDTSIAWGSDDLMWVNGGPQGCSGGTSSVKATDEEKAKFKRAVDIVEELVAKGE